MTPITESTLGGVLSGSIVELLKLAAKDRRNFEQVFRQTLAKRLKVSGNKNKQIVNRTVKAILIDTEIQRWLDSPQLASDLPLLQKLSGKLELDISFLQEFFRAFEIAVAENETLNKIYQNRHAAAQTQETRELRRLLSGQLTEDLIQSLDAYRRKVREEFSSIMLFGDRTRDDESVFARMSDIQRGFVPLHLKPWGSDLLNPLPEGAGVGSSTGAVAEAEAGERLEIEDVFFQNRERLILIRGLPGGGKTTLLRYLAWRYADENLAMLPVYIRLKKLKLYDKKTLAAFIRQEVSTTWTNKPIEKALRTEECFLETPMLLLLDGIDEIEDADSAARFAEALGELVQANKRCNIIVASRPLGLEKGDYPEFHALDLDVLTQEMIDAYLGKWFGDDENKIAALQNTLAVKPRMRALAENPFLLSMICYAFEEKGDAALIAQRSTLYEACTQRLLARMYTLDHDPVGRTSNGTKVAKPQALAMLKDLALRYFLWQEAEFPADQVNVLAREALESKEAELATAVLDDLQRETGLVQRAQDGYTFVHRTLWEYFTALALKDKNDVLFVIRQAANPLWEEVVRLYAGLLDEDGSGGEIKISRDEIKQKASISPPKVQELVAGLWNINRPLTLRVTTEVQAVAADLLEPLIAGEAGNQGKLLLIDGLAQSLPLIAERQRKPLVDETLRILLIDCRETDCEVIYHAEQLLERLGMQPLAKGGLIYDLLDLENAAQRQKDLLADPVNHFEWIEVEGGEFLMGDDAHESNEKPAHRVKVDSFRMMKHPVTNLMQMQADFPFGDKYGHGGDDCPAIGNTWWEAYYFALWIGCLLPTEAEWEYAARGGKKMHEQGMLYYFEGGEAELPNHAWFSEPNRREAHAVNKLNPHTRKEHLNPLGLANMLGNVWEWCNDWHGNYATPQNPDDVLENPQGPPSGVRRVLRGGACYNTADDLRCAYRDGGVPTYRSVVVGFRCVQDGF